MITMHSTARSLARKGLGMSAKRLEEVMSVMFKHWHDGLADGDEVELPTIGRIYPRRWTLTAQHSLYRTRVGKKPLNRKYTWVFRIEGNVNLKAKLRRSMSK